MNITKKVKIAALALLISLLGSQTVAFASAIESARKSDKIMKNSTVIGGYWHYIDSSTAICGSKNMI